MLKQIFLFLIIIATWHCSPNDKIESETLFQSMDSDHTGILFSNIITPNDSVNLLSYEYMYNGGGVGVGNFDGNQLPDLFFTGNIVSSKIYVNKGALKFEDITSKSGINTTNKWCRGVSIVDINLDGYDDIYLSVGGVGNKSEYPNLLYINNQNLTFTESAASYGLADLSETNQAAFFDYDLDGDLDLYLLNGGGFEKSPLMVRPILNDGSNRNNDRLYQNNFDKNFGHAVFTDVSLQAGITYEGFGLGLAIIDANEDGWPDIYVSNDYLSRDLFYENQQNGKFIEKASTYFDHTSYFSMGSDVGDINNDGHLDLMTLDMLPSDYYNRKMMYGPDELDKYHVALQYGYGHQYMRNMLHLNNGSGSFSEIGNMLGLAKTDWSWSPMIADFDNDGLQDIYVTNGYGKDLTDLDFVKFRREANTPFSDPSMIKKKLLEALDKQRTIEPSNFIFKNDGDLHFTNKSGEWGCNHPSISSGAVYEDLDLDGDLDIVTNNINAEAFVFKNKLSDKPADRRNFLQVKLKGGKDNPQGIGATVKVFCKKIAQLKYLNRNHGFQSSTSEKLHFGIGNNLYIDSLQVIWPDGKMNTSYNVSANQVLSISYHDSSIKKATLEKNNLPFSPVNIIDFEHEENNYIDQKNQLLLQHGFSNQGPAIAIGDLNGDQLDDVFIGGAYHKSSAIYFQNKKSQFTLQKLNTEEYEDLGVIMLDIENDGDLDVYMASGGSERYVYHKKYQDRIYINNGKGDLVLDSTRLPEMLTSTASVSAGDIDLDGDLDLFVGGRVVPGKYPMTPPSYLLINERGFYKDATLKYNSALKSIGMVTSSLWSDFDNDGRTDLMIVGEFMKIHLFKNESNKLVDVSDKYGLSQTQGQWNSINGGDLDNDGDTDYVLGNIGLNTPYHVSEKSPYSIYFADFDNNGSIDPIYANVENNVVYPYTSLDLLSQQVPLLKKKYLHYRDFAKANIGEIVSSFPEKKYETLQCKLAHTIILENEGRQKFKIHKLPRLAQLAPTNGTLIKDINGDGQLDILMVGNIYDTDVVHGRYDGHKGMTLVNKGKFIFDLMSHELSGFVTKGNSKSLASMVLANNKQWILVGENDGKVLNYEVNSIRNSKFVSFVKGESAVIADLIDGSKCKIEHYTGCGYLTQNSNKISLPITWKSASFLDVKGKETRKIYNKITDNN